MPFQNLIYLYILKVMFLVIGFSYSGVSISDDKVVSNSSKRGMGQQISPKSSTLSSKGSSVKIFSDLGIFRFSDQVYLLSDVKKFCLTALTFDQIFGKSNILEHFAPIISNGTDSICRKWNRKNIGKYWNEIQQILVLLKLINYIQTQKVIINSKSWNQLQQNASKLNIIVDFVNDKDFILLVRSEFFFNSRFSPNAFWISNSELLKEKNNLPGLSDKELKEQIIARKIAGSVKDFTGFLHKQIPHYSLWK